MTARGVLVVGTYPPIPLPSAAATVDAVRRSWDEGDEVTVVAPRPSAAHLTIPIAGSLAGRRLDHARRFSSADHLVLVAERGFPVPVGSKVRQWVTVAGLIRPLRRFEHVTVVRVGRLGVSGSVERKLMGQAHRVLDHPVEDVAPGDVTVLGPAEILPRAWPRYLAGRAARRVLGRHAEGVRSRAASILRVGSSAG